MKSPYGGIFSCWDDVLRITKLPSLPVQPDEVIQACGIWDKEFAAFSVMCRKGNILFWTIGLLHKAVGAYATAEEMDWIGFMEKAARIEANAELYRGADPSMSKSTGENAFFYGYYCGCISAIKTYMKESRDEQ